LINSSVVPNIDRFSPISVVARTTASAIPSRGVEDALYEYQNRYESLPKPASHRIKTVDMVFPNLKDQEM